MPITKSATKALRQSVRRHTRNLKKKEAYKDAVKIVRKLAETGKFDEAKAKLSTLFKTLDKAAKTHVIKENKASRLKSRISKLVGKEKG